MGGAAAPLEGLLIPLDLHAIQRDGLKDRRLRQRQQPLLPSVAHQEQVAGDGIAEQPRGDAGGVQQGQLVGTQRTGQPRTQILAGINQVWVAGEVAGDRLLGVHHGPGSLGVDGRQRLIAAGHKQVAAKNQIRPALVDARRVDVLRPRRDAHMGGDRTALLREPELVDDRGALAVDVRGHAQQRADGDDASAADAADQYGVGAVLRYGGRHRLRDRLQGGRHIGRTATLARLGA